MKYTNEAIVNMFDCIKQTLDSQEIKKAIPDSGKAVYAFVKNRAYLAPLVTKISEDENIIKLAVSESLAASKTDDEKDKIIAKGNEELKQLYKNEQECDKIHKINMNIAEELQKYLNESATVGLFSYLILETEE